MTSEEAKAILDACRTDYHDFDGAEPWIIDGNYTLKEVEALLVLARESAAKRYG